MGDDIPACYVIVYQSVHLGDILEGDNPFQKKMGWFSEEKEIKMNWPSYAPTVVWNLYLRFGLIFLKMGKCR